MHMLLFDIVPLHNDALLVSFNELLHPFEKKLFGCARSHVCTACWTSPCEPNRYTC
jgi:hypothetical protein